jgi:GAF domain-containing protein
MTERKLARYIRIREQIAGLLEKSSDSISAMATINALLYHKMDGFFWVGFYLLHGDRLCVGPYQGPLACLELERNKGVCWTSLQKHKTIVVPDVDEFPGHIACDPRSRSEIAVPVIDKSGHFFAVLDIDSNLKQNFDHIDAGQLELIVAMLSK